jgi:MFS family permease
MLQSISWMVMREPAAERGRAQAGMLAWFFAGGVAGGAMMGAIITVPAWGLVHVIGSRPTAFVIAAAAAAAVYAGRAAGLWRFPKPQFPSQVPEAWRNIFSRNVASFIYAAGLGMIYFTRLASFAAYPLAVVLLGMGRTPLAIIEIMAAVGLTRAATGLAVPLLRLDTASDEPVQALMRRLSPRMERGELAVLGCLTLLPFVILLAHTR